MSGVDVTRLTCFQHRTVSTEFNRKVGRSKFDPLIRHKSRMRQVMDVVVAVQRFPLQLDKYVRTVARFGLNLLVKVRYSVLLHLSLLAL